MGARYGSQEELKDTEGRRYIKNAIYPEIPVTENDIYVITTAGDRYDRLALQFYGDSKLWWVIASANASKSDGLIVEQGIQLRIPASGQAALTQFEAYNEDL